MNFFETGSVRVKICGITSEEDARMCTQAGADALGFNFYQGSKRYLNPAEALPWIRDLGHAVARVAVVVNPSEELLRELREAGCFEAIQYHGDESPTFCDWAGFSPWIKAFRVRSETSLQTVGDYETSNLLLDAFVEGAYGGTGTRLDWDMVRDYVVANPGPRYILAGGLTVYNVRQAVRIVRPHAVDVAGGVELTPGKKEEYLVREFIRAVRG